ncbi:MAG: hypothetical protein FWD02_02895 [Bacteroidales bacterium]|nr:hypothetical protein [Bacteroidales bacterium]
MKTWKITKDMKEPIPGYREYVFFNDDENGKPIDQEWFRHCYELMEKQSSKNVRQPVNKAFFEHLIT